MGKLFIPAEQNIEGPFLLDKKILMDLDDIIKNAHSKLTLASPGNLSPEKKPTITMQVTLTSKNKSVITDDSISGILKDQKVNDFKPSELLIEVGSRYNRDPSLTMKVTQDYNTLEYSIKCVDDKIKDEINYEIEEWIENNKPSKIATLWFKWGFLLNIIIFCSILILFVSSIDIKVSPERIALENHISTLLKDGINDDNQNKAIELLLSATSNAKASKAQLEINTKRLKLIVILLIVFVMVCIGPKTTIGLGKNLFKLNFYKFWVKFCLITIPSILILPKLIEIVTLLLYK